MVVIPDVSPLLGLLGARFCPVFGSCFESVALFHAPTVERRGQFGYSPFIGREWGPCVFWTPSRNVLRMYSLLLLQVCSSRLSRR